MKNFLDIQHRCDEVYKALLWSLAEEEKERRRLGLPHTLSEGWWWGHRDGPLLMILLGPEDIDFIKAQTEGAGEGTNIRYHFHWPFSKRAAEFPAFLVVSTTDEYTEWNSTADYYFDFTPLEDILTWERK